MEKTVSNKILGLLNELNINIVYFELEEIKDIIKEIEITLNRCHCFDNDSVSLFRLFKTHFHHLNDERKYIKKVIVNNYSELKKYCVHLLTIADDILKSDITNQLNKIEQCIDSDDMEQLNTVCLSFMSILQDKQDELYIRQCMISLSNVRRSIMRLQAIDREIINLNSSVEEFVGLFRYYAYK